MGAAVATRSPLAIQARYLAWRSVLRTMRQPIMIVPSSYLVVGLAAGAPLEAGWGRVRRIRPLRRAPQRLWGGGSGPLPAHGRAAVPELGGAAAESDRAGLVPD